MLNVSLFLGFCLNPLYEKALAEMDPSLRELCISDHHESYLNPLYLDGCSYLGKFLGEIVYISEMELLEKSIYSILNKILPGFSHKDIFLEVLAVSSSSH